MTLLPLLVIVIDIFTIYNYILDCIQIQVNLIKKCENPQFSVCLKIVRLNMSYLTQSKITLIMNRFSEI